MNYPQGRLTMYAKTWSLKYYLEKRKVLINFKFLTMGLPSDCIMDKDEFSTAYYSQKLLTDVYNRRLDWALAGVSQWIEC